MAVLVIVIVAVCVPSVLSARQIAEEDRIRLAAFEHLATALFPADTAAGVTHCFALRDEADFESPPEGPGLDPGAVVLRGIRQLVPRAVAASECPETGGTGPQGSDGSPVHYFVGAPTQAGSAIRVPVSYRVNGLSGGGWTCSFGLENGRWRVVDCLPAWISPPY